MEMINIPIAPTLTFYSRCRTEPEL